jgi:hypothetical protein
MWIVDDERDQEQELQFDFMRPLVDSVHQVAELKGLLDMHRQIHNRKLHQQLQNDLVEQI